MKQSARQKRGPWFWIGVILLSISALWWLLLISVGGDMGDAVLTGVVTTAVPIGIGIYCVRHGRKEPAAGMVRANEPANLGDAKSVESLIRLLGHEDESVRKHTAEALGKIGDTRAVKPLTRALKDDSWVVQVFAEEALEKIKAKHA